MSRRNIKDYNTYRECYFKGQNEPEEGEIVDDYDLIVSSDEELSMRQRIRELEAENEEIEQIAVISRSYVDKISHPHYYFESSRAAQVPTDASSISSAEFVTPKKRKRQKSREHKRKHCHRQHQHNQDHQFEPYLRYDPQKLPLKARVRRSHCKRRQKLFAKKHKKNHSDHFINKGVNAETLSLESSESSYLTDTDNKFLEFKRKESLNNEKYITRDTLRLAVARNTNESRYPFKKSCLKDKLQRQELVGKSLNTSSTERHDFHDKNDDDDDVQVIENEPDIQTVDENSTDSMEEKELRLIALKSAVLKKHMARKMRNAEAAYSPTDFDDMLSSSLLRQENKLDDIDIVDLEAEDSQTACVIVSPEASPQLMMLDDQDESQHMVDCKPVDMDIANSDSDAATVDNWSKDVELSFPKYSLDSNDFINNIQYRFHMQNLHELPPPPPGVDDYDNVPPPPPYHILYNAESQDMDLDNEQLAEDQNDMTKTAKDALEDKQAEKETEDDEEEEALRALLLSKFQSPKNQRKTKFKDTLYKVEVVSQSNCQPKPTETILKEAVKRLKTHSQPEQCKDETSIDICNNSQCLIRDKSQERPANNIASLNRFKKSGKNSNIHENQLQSVTTDQSKEDSDIGLLEQHHTEETSVNSNVSICDDQTKLNSLEVNSTIDISDITRRLQKIKENVLNLTHNISPSHHPNNLSSAPQVMDISQPPSEGFKVAENLESNQTSLENVLQSNIPSTNNLVNTVSANNELNTALTKNKTVQANFDVITNQTTFKVTITNNEALKSEENQNTTTINGVTYKENNTNVNVTNNLPLKINGNTKNKVALNSEKIIKVANKTTESNSKNKVQVIKSVSAAIQNVKNPTPLLRTTKIVKPNKVINASFEVNLRQAPQASESASVLKLSLPETNDHLSNISDNSRLITSIDQVKHMCAVAPFVISVQNSSNESSEEEGGQDYDSLYKPLYDYNDNVSPLSLNLESPTRTPLRSNSPIEPCADGNTKQADMEAFNSIRKTTSLHAENVSNNTPLTNLSVNGDKINKTPLAVRHLPAAAQSEYRRLVHRMKLLENKRKLAKLEENINECKTIKKTCRVPPAKEDPCKEKDKVDDINSVPKTSLVKKVLLRNANNNTTSTTATAMDTQLSKVSTNSSSKVNKSNVLRSYENLYVKFGAGIVNNLDKSLKLVEEAKKVKIEKLKLENRLKELKAEMEVLQAKHKEEQQKISRIYPNICTTNEIISSLKQKRSKVFKAALDLGKSLKGEDYRLNNDLKECITTKSKKLATEIKIVNLLKAQDVTSIKNVLVINPISEEQAENKTEKIEDCEMKSNKENNKINPTPNDVTNNAMIRTETRDEEEKKENNSEPPLKNDFGGNTEFQSLESLNSKSSNSTDDTCQPNKDTKLNTANSPKCSDQSFSLSSYISPLEHLRNIDSNVDPNGIVCPYDLMGNCEDVTCKYVHITAKAKT